MTTLDSSKATKNNIEQSWISLIKTLASPILIDIKGRDDNSVFISMPDTQKQNTQFPVVVASVLEKLEGAVGQGKIGHGGRRQTKFTYSLAVGIVGRTSSEIGKLEEAISSHFSNRHFLVRI